MSWAPTSISQPAVVASNFTDGLAVLPLENLSGNEEDEFFATGMTDALIAELAKIGSLRVISRRSIIQYKGVAKPLKEIATELNVANVVEGTVLHSGDRLRISVQLLEGATDRMVWSESYERDMCDILALQREVARSIAREVRIKLTPEEEAALGSGARKVNPAAAEASLRAVYFIHKGTPFFDKTLEYAEEAIRIDPEHAPAHALLAILYGLMGFSGALPVEEASEKGRASALRAIELDDTLGIAHLSLANIKANYDWDWAGAEAKYRRALELNPGSADTHNFYARLLGNLGRFDEALQALERATVLQPQNAKVFYTLGHLYDRKHMGEEAALMYRKARELSRA